MNEAERIDLFTDALRHDPQAPPPPGLDPQAAETVRALVQSERARQLEAAQQARLWERALAQAAQFKQSETIQTRHKADGIEQIITIRRPSANGQTSETDQAGQGEILFIAPHEFEQFQPRPHSNSRMRWLTLVAAVLVVALMGVLTVIVFRSGYIGNLPLTNAEPTATPTPPVITSENAGQLELRRLFGYGVLNSLHWLAGDNRLVFTTANGTIGFLNPRSLNASPEIAARRYLTIDSSLVLTASLSPDGKTVAFADMKKRVTLWNMETGEQHSNALGNFGQIRHLAFSSDGALVAGGTANNMIYIWNAQTGDEIAQWSNPAAGAIPYEGGVYDVAFSPDGKLLAAAYANHTVELREVSTGNVLATLSGHKDSVNSVAFSPDGSLITSGGKDGMVLLWDWREGMGTQHVTLHDEGSSISRVMFSPDERTLAAVSADNHIYLWDVVSAARLGAMTGHSDSIIGMAFSPDGAQLASASLDETVRLWDVATVAEAQQVMLPRGQDKGVEGAAFTPDGKTLVSAGVDQTLRWWDIDQNAERSVVDTFGKMVYGVAFSPDGKSAASVSENGVLRLWDMATGVETVVLEHPEGADSAVAFSPDGGLLAAGGSLFDLSVRLWDTVTGENRAVLEGHTDAVRSVAFSPDGKLLASAGLDHSIRLWDVATGTLYKRLEGHTGAVYRVAFSPDGATLASSGADNVVRLWDIETGSQLKLLDGTPMDVFALAYSPDGSLIVSGSGEVTPGYHDSRLRVEDTTIRLWNAASGKQVGELEGHILGVDAVSFSPDGSMLMSASEDGTIRLWGLPPAGG